MQDIEDEKRIEETNTDDKKNDTWKDYLGSDDGNKMEIVIRFPDGNKEKVMFPSDSKIKVIKMLNH